MLTNEWKDRPDTDTETKAFLDWIERHFGPGHYSDDNDIVGPDDSRTVATFYAGRTTDTVYVEYIDENYNVTRTARLPHWGATPLPTAPNQ